MERQQKEQRQHIDQLEQYIHNVTKETENKRPVIKNHRFMDIYNIPIRA
jgi:thymidylate synthase